MEPSPQRDIAGEARSTAAFMSLEAKEKAGTLSPEQAAELILLRLEMARIFPSAGPFNNPASTVALAKQIDSVEP